MKSLCFEVDDNTMYTNINSGKGFSAPKIAFPTNNGKFTSAAPGLQSEPSFGLTGALCPARVPSHGYHLRADASYHFRSISIQVHTIRYESK